MVEVERRAFGLTWISRVRVRMGLKKMSAALGNFQEYLEWERVDTHQRDSGKQQDTVPYLSRNQI